MKIDFKPLRKMAAEYLRNNAEMVINLIGDAIVCAVCREFNIPMNVGCKPRSGYSQRSCEPEFTVNFMPRNSTETAIFSVLRSTANMSWDSSRIDAAKTIRDIISNNPVSDETRSFAIMALCNIAEKMDWDSSRKTVTDIISSITKGAN